MSILKTLCFCFFTVLFFTASVAHATPINRATAEAYFENCKKNEDPRFPKKVQATFCACTAAELMKSFTLEEMQATAQQNQAGRKATNKLITDIYAPCIQYPAKTYHYNTCIKDPKSGILGNAEKICSCSAKLVANHLQANAKPMFEKILRTNPNVTDPMQALYDDPDFQKLIQSKSLSCVQ